MAIHGTCGKTIPNGNNSGHCGGCHEGFIGNTSFEAHRVGSHHLNERRCELQPYESTTESGAIKYGHWQDDNGYWRYGKQLTEAEKAEVLAKRIGATETEATK